MVEQKNWTHGAPALGLPASGATGTDFPLINDLYRTGAVPQLLLPDAQAAEQTRKGSKTLRSTPTADALTAPARVCAPVPRAEVTPG